jgi:hypothetical protein
VGEAGPGRVSLFLAIRGRAVMPSLPGAGEYSVRLIQLSAAALDGYFAGEDDYDHWDA